MCELFNVSRSGYYRWLKHKPDPREKRAQLLKQEILKIYHKGRGCYGSPRIYRDLLKLGLSCGKKRVEQLMKALGIRARHKKKHKATIDSLHNHPVAENLLNQNFKIFGPNQC